MPAVTSLVTGILLVICPDRVQSDEGMWTYSAPPRQILQDRYGFVLENSWLEHLQKASVRFNNGGSGSFVSEDGLILSNHHVGADALQKFGDAQHDYIRDGFFARTPGEEKKCHDLELNVLMSLEDVTGRVNAAVKSGMSAEDAFLARRAVIADIEKESLDRTGLRSDVVTLFQGAQYHLYRFKKYIDVRLVFAPEKQIAFFGGDPDNFEYPRYDLDICLFRAYEDGRPAKVPHHLRWSRTGVADNELVFVSGHPGGTSRLLTVAELVAKRDVWMPGRLGQLKELEVLLAAYSARSGENARRAQDALFGVQNSRKALDGEYAGLLDPGFMASKQASEQELRQSVATASDPSIRAAAGAWDRIATAQSTLAPIAHRLSLLEGGDFNSELFAIARTLLRAAAESSKPNTERLSEFGEAGRESLEFQLFSEKPIYPDLEELMLADALTRLSMKLGYSDPVVQAALAGKSPRDRAVEVIRATSVGSVAARRKLYDGGQSAVDAANDPMIDLARAVDAEARRVRRIAEAANETAEQAHSHIAQARFALLGTNTYPDATFTLRLAFGVVKGYQQNGRPVPCQTTLAGLYERAAEQGYRPPFDLPQRWIERRNRLNLQTPLNFVSTADIIGGNSGSPVVNRQGEFVGIIFDGNIQSLVLDLGYTENLARAVSVNAQAIVEALHKIYDARTLADELLTGKRG
jgi:hypothetical protein